MSASPPRRNIGQELLEKIVTASLFRAECPDNCQGTYVIVWSSGAAEQLEAMVRELFPGQPNPSSDAKDESEGYGSVWYEFESPPETMVRGYEAQEQECVATLVNGIPDEGGSATKKAWEMVVRVAFQAGLAAVKRKSN